MKFQTTLLLILSYTINNSQQTPLSDQLWDRVETCNSMLEDFDEDGKTDYDELIDDSKNGYLKISGSYPTCGCSCTFTTAAFKNSKKEYIFLDKKEWSCEWKYEINSSSNITDLLPLQLESKLSEYDAEVNHKNAYFYYNIEIPQYGTDTKLQVKVIPIGIEMASQSGSAFTTNYQESGNVRKHYWYNIPSIIQKLDKATIDLLLRKAFNEITEKDLTILNSFIDEKAADLSKFKSLEELANAFDYLAAIYDEYQMLSYTEITMSWNKDLGRFEVKSGDKVPESISFIEFVSQLTFWSPIC